jgi:tRNA A37 threonylcarbamoyladenosine modification protein TsaB
VSCGPGSFTGIKIGLAFAQGLLRGAKQKLRGIGLSSLELVAAGLMQQDSSFAALYLAATKTRGAVAMRSGSKLALSDTDISIERPPIEGNIYLMEAWPMLESQVSRQLVPIADPLRVSLEVMAKKVESLARESFRSDIVFEPLYLRKSTAEESLARIQEKKKG